VAEELTFEQMEREEQHEDFLAEKYAELKDLPGWNLFLSRLGEWVTRAEERLYRNESSDPQIVYGFWLAWKERKKLLNSISVEVDELVSEFKQRKQADLEFLKSKVLQPRQAFK
jgi:mannose-6-phosphate isomerase class I